jgi:transposase
MFKIPASMVPALFQGAKPFPLWSTVYGYFRRFAECGARDEMLAVLRIAEREASGREASPSAAIIDSHASTGSA